MTEPFIAFVTNDEKHFGIKNLRWEIVDGQYVARANVGGDQECGEPFLAECTNLLRKFFESEFKSYGLIEPK